MENNKLYNNYLKSLSQKYHAVCFDIDGTLTEKNSKNISNKAIEIISDLLSNKIPIVFITGRGETGLNDLKNDIYEKLKGNKNITNDDLYRMFVLTNDGARLFYSKNEFLDSDSYISTEHELEELNEVNNYILNLIKKNNKFRSLVVNYSKDLKTGLIINIRLILENADNNIIEDIYDQLLSFIKNMNLLSVYVTRGIYKGNTVFQIGTATKDKAIERTEKLIGIPKDSMIRIGDCGDTKGNDYAMLNCEQGYSVDKTSGSINSCFPVFDDSANIISGVDATCYLIKKAKILPTVCLEKTDKEVYKKDFANVERSIVQGRNKILRNFNYSINSNFFDCNGIDDLFDNKSGSVIIPMYEMELLNDNPLKDFWLTKRNDCLSYSLRDDNNYMLRGSDTYYYFLANRISKSTDITKKEHVINWHQNYLNFMNDASFAVNKTKNLNDNNNKKFILGIMDNCRNSLLIILNHYLVTSFNNNTVLLDISAKDDNISSVVYGALMIVERMMKKICFENNSFINHDDVNAAIDLTKQVLYMNLNLEYNKKIKNDYSKDYRAYREIDNYAENFIAVSLYKDNCDNKQLVDACGLSYGGIELPLLAKIIDKERIDKVLLLHFNKDASGYTNKHLIDLRKFNINDIGGILNANNFIGSDVDMFDDNVLTGKTLQLSINSLYDCNINVKNICIVRYPGINRLDQMYFDNSTAVDYKLFFNYIYGLCFNSPYSWKDNEWFNDDGDIDYTDSLGIFDLNRKKIVECLFKNHSYSDESEVAKYIRRLKK